MGRSMALLGLVLLMSVHALRYQVTPRSKPDHFVDISNYLYRISFLGLPVEDAKDWTLSAWSFIEATGAQQHIVLQTSQPRQLISFYAGTLIIGSTDLMVQAPAINLPTLVWIHTLMGFNGVDFFAVVTLRNGAQYTAKGEKSNLKLMSDFSYHGSDTTSFTVRTT